MPLEKIKKQLLRDIKKSPAKAASLGALSLVAVYFWAPLAMSWIRGGETAPKADVAPSSAMVAVMTAAPAGLVPAASSPANVSWEQLVQWMASDPRMRPAEMDVASISPFRDSINNAADEMPPTAASTGRAQGGAMSLEPLGLKVSSIMVGRERRVAVINGRPYAEGREIAAQNDRVFKIAKVEERHVILERNGQQFELTIADSNPVDAVQLRFDPQ